MTAAATATTATVEAAKITGAFYPLDRNGHHAVRGRGDAAQAQRLGRASQRRAAEPRREGGSKKCDAAQ
jgi:hypothetical protein